MQLWQLGIRFGEIQVAEANSQLEKAVPKRAIFGWMMFDWAAQPFFKKDKQQDHVQNLFAKLLYENYGTVPLRLVDMFQPIFKVCTVVAATQVAIFTASRHVTTFGDPLHLTWSAIQL